MDPTMLQLVGRVKRIGQRFAQQRTLRTITFIKHDFGECKGFE